jgi:hypothetical protein
MTGPFKKSSNCLSLDGQNAGAIPEREKQDYQDAVEGIRRGYGDLRAGRVRPLEESLEALREKHGLPRLSGS